MWPDHTVPVGSPALLTTINGNLAPPETTGHALQEHSAKTPEPDSDTLRTPSPQKCKTQFRNKKNKVCGLSFPCGDTLHPGRRCTPPCSCEAPPSQAGPSLGIMVPSCASFGLLVNPWVLSATAWEKGWASEICVALRQRAPILQFF